MLLCAVVAVFTKELCAVLAVVVLVAGLALVAAGAVDTVPVAVLAPLKPDVVVVLADTADPLNGLFCNVLALAADAGVFEEAEVLADAVLTVDLDNVEAVAAVLDENRLDPAVTPVDTAGFATAFNVEVLLNAEDELCAVPPNVVRAPKEEDVLETAVFFSSLDVEFGGENLFSLLSVNAITTKP